MKHGLVFVVAAYLFGAFASMAGEPETILSGALRNMREKSYVAGYSYSQGTSRTVYHRANPDGTVDERTEFLWPDGRKDVALVVSGGKYHITPDGSVIRRKWLEGAAEFSDDGETVSYSMRYPVVFDGHDCYEIGKTLTVTQKTFARYAALPQNRNLAPAELEDRFESLFPALTVYYVDKSGMFLRGKAAYSQSGEPVGVTRYGDVTFRDDFPDGTFELPRDRPVLVADSIEKDAELRSPPPAGAEPSDCQKYYKYHIYWGLAGLLIVLLAADIFKFFRKAGPIPPPPKWRCLSWALCGLFGLLLALAYPPYNLWWLAFVAFVPLFLVVFTAGACRACWGGLLGGAIFASINFSFLLPLTNHSEVVAAFMTAMVLIGVFYLIFALASALLWRGLPDVGAVRRQIVYAVCVASCFVLFEAGRAYVSPWNFLAVTQYKNNPMLQLCSLGGIYMVSFAVMLINAWLAVSICSLLQNRRHSVRQCIVALSLPAAVFLSAGAWKIFGTPDRGAAEILRVGLVQTDFLPPIASAGARRSPAERFNEIISQIDGMSGGEGGIDVIVLPECAVPGGDIFSGPGRMRAKLHRRASRKSRAIIFGTLEMADALGKFYHNRAFFLRKETRSPAGTYDKMEPVPLLEFIPPWLSFLRPYLPGGSQAIPGSTPAVFELPGGQRAGINICYDDIFPRIARLNRVDGASLLIVIANDAGFGEAEKEQHFANAVFRAVENGIPMIRSCNSAPSLVVGADGTIADGVKPLTEGRDFGDYCAAFTGSKVVSVAVPASEPTFFSKHGNWFVRCCGFVVAAACVFIAVCFCAKRLPRRKAAEKL